MQIDYTGRQIEVGPDLRQYTEKRLSKLSRVLQDHLDIHVILTAEKHRRVAEITLKFRDHTLVAVEQTNDSRSSINGALDKLERQALRLLARNRTRKRRPKPAEAVVLTALSPAHAAAEEVLELETERIPIKPMMVEEAIASLNTVGTGVVVFRNAETERVNVIYRRPDGRPGLIEPEP